MASSKRQKMPAKPTKSRSDFEFDVAFSFLDQDKGLALTLESKLQPNLNVFVYSTRQQVLAGTEGLESFRNVFLSLTRLVVVLYRSGWGSTRFTRIEEIAIRDRGFDQHWEDFLLFVTLNDNDVEPAWLPKHHIRLSYPTYGPDQLLGAIKVRAQAIGALPKVESAIQKAIRLEQEAKTRKERQELLAGGMASVQAEVGVTFDALDQRLSELQAAVASLKLEWYRDQIRQFAIRTALVSMNIVPNWDHPADKSHLQAIQLFGPVKFPHETGTFFPGPKRLGEREYYADFDLAYGGWCWRRGREHFTARE